VTRALRACTLSQLPDRALHLPSRSAFCGWREHPVNTYHYYRALCPLYEYGPPREMTLGIFKSSLPRRECPKSSPESGHTHTLRPASLSLVPHARLFNARSCLWRQGYLAYPLNGEALKFEGQEVLGRS
jgi:hypothetical protein